MMKKVLITILVASFALANLTAQAGELKASAKLPKADGKVEAGEYQVTTKVQAFTLSATLGTDKQIYLALTADVGGWLAFGIGSQKMDGAKMLIASTKDGKPDLSEQDGKGHMHTLASEKIAKSWSFVSDGKTGTLEVVISADLAKDGVLQLILGGSKDNDLRSKHMLRAATSLKLTK